MNETYFYLLLSLSLTLFMIYKFRQLYLKYRQGFGIRNSPDLPHVFVNARMAKKSHRRALLVETVAVAVGLLMAILCTYLITI